MDLTSSREKLGRSDVRRVTARSYHPGGVNALLGDGSVRFVKDRDGQTWRALGTVAGGEVITRFVLSRDRGPSIFGYNAGDVFAPEGRR